jgi:hypothetical protein
MALEDIEAPGSALAGVPRVQDDRGGDAALVGIHQIDHVAGQALELLRAVVGDLRLAAAQALHRMFDRRGLVRRAGIHVVHDGDRIAPLAFGRDEQFRRQHRARRGAIRG